MNDANQALAAQKAQNEELARENASLQRVCNFKVCMAPPRDNSAISCWAQLVASSAGAVVWLTLRFRV